MRKQLDMCSWTDRKSTLSTKTLFGRMNTGHGRYRIIAQLHAEVAAVRRSALPCQLSLCRDLYAAIVAGALYDKAESDPNFAAEYEEFLGRGESDSQTRLLSIGIRLDDPDIVKPLVKLFIERREELRTLYISATLSSSQTQTSLNSC
jgi:hypothetical protein